MTALHDFLDYLAGHPLGTVVHVHPGEPELADRYASLGARRVVLVSGDPDVLPGLRRLLHGRPWLTLVESVVAPEPGERQWLRYNVAGLNGLLTPGAALQEFYPRLRLQESVPVQARSLQAVLDELPMTGEEGANVLVLETPGLEDGLLRSLRPECLALFEWLLLRGARPRRLADGVDSEAATRSLKERGWREARRSADEPLWPVTLLQFDAAAAERAALLQRVQAAEAELKTLREARAAAEHDAVQRAAHVALLTQERDALGCQVGELTARVDAGVEAHAAKEAAAREQEVRIDSLSQAKAALEHAAAEHARQTEKADAERATLGRRVADLEAELRSLGAAKVVAEQHVAQRAAQAEALSEAKTALEKTVGEHLEQIRQIARERQEVAALAEERAQRIGELAGLLKERDALVEQLRSELQTVTQARTALEGRLTDLDIRQRMVDEEMFKAEGQIALIRDLLLREPGL